MSLANRSMVDFLKADSDSHFVARLVVIFKNTKFGNPGVQKNDDGDLEPQNASTVRVYLIVP